MEEIENRSDTLGLGKVSREVLRRSVLPFLPLGEPPSLDGGAVQLMGRTIVAHSPSIGVPLEALGFFAFHYAASNVASLFARPRHLVTGIYLPPGTREEELRTIARGLGDEARKYGVTVAAGQTATYQGIETPLVTATCLGEPVKQPGKPREDDRVVVVGAVGGEALWLKALSEGCADDRWRRFTPLPAALRLQEVEGVKLMHDVSEGGVKGALHEVAEALNLRIDASSHLMPYADGVESLGVDVLRAPTYGVLIAVVDPAAVEDVSRACEEMGYPCSTVGRVKEGEGLYVDGVEVEKVERTALDELYGTFAPRDEIIDALRRAFAALEDYEEISSLVPQVGTNMVYARLHAASVEEVAGLSGRVIVSLGRPRVCGEVAYGGSRHMASVVLEAMRLNPAARAAANIRGGDDIIEALRDMGLSVSMLPPTASGDGCPVVSHIRKTAELHDAYAHPGAFGIEPTTTLVGETPDHLLRTLVELARRV